MGSGLAGFDASLCFPPVKPNSSQGECSHIQVLLSSSSCLADHVFQDVRCAMAMPSRVVHYEIVAGTEQGWAKSITYLWWSFLQSCRDSMRLSYSAEHSEHLPLQSSADHQSGGSPPKMPLALESSEFFRDSHCRIAETESNRTISRWSERWKWRWSRSSW